MEFTAQQIAQLLGGELRGNAQAKVRTAGRIQDSQEGEITFLANMKYENYLYTTQAGVVIVGKDFVPKKEVAATLIAVEDAYSAFSRLMEIYQELIQSAKIGIEQPSFCTPSAVYGDNFYLGAFAYLGHNVRIGHHVKIYPQCYIGDNVVIGDHTVIYAGVKIYADTQIGQHCTIHAGAVIGSAGFGYAPQPDGSFKYIPQLGNVVLSDHVDIGANTTIDRAAIGSTFIGQGAKLDNLIQIAHNVSIGKNTVIAAQAGVSGSSVLGESCMVGGQAGIVGHLQIAKGTKIAAQSGVTKSFETEGGAIQGAPAFDHKASLKSYVIYKNLPALQKKVNDLENKLSELERKE
jgi:UDP-3-O-[3-hydroxymyristoyl] glucosamine N-acyltransferase